MYDFGIQGRSGGGLRCLTLKGGEHIKGGDLRVVLTSPPHLETRGIEARLRLGERLFNTRK